MEPLPGCKYVVIFLSFRIFDDLLVTFVKFDILITESCKCTGTATTGRESCELPNSTSRHKH